MSVLILRIIFYIRYLLIIPQSPAELPEEDNNLLSRLQGWGGVGTEHIRPHTLPPPPINISEISSQTDYREDDLREDIEVSQSPAELPEEYPTILSRLQGGVGTEQIHPHTPPPTVTQNGGPWSHGAPPPQ